jgi:hypothetical protein
MRSKAAINGGARKDPDLSQHALKERRALVQRVLASHEIANSGRMRGFLAYVCERALRDPSAEIHEQEIGHNVFDRPADYDPHDDNIVRVTASNIRKKLGQYFASDGISEQMILEIPRGRYTPIFRERDPADSEGTDLPEVRIQRKLAIYRRLVLVVAAGALLLGIFAVWSGMALRRERREDRSARDANPALNALWSQLLVPTVHTDIIVADSSLSLYEELVPNQITLDQYLKPGEWTPATALSANPELRVFAQRAVQLGLTSMGSVIAAYRIAQLARGDRGPISILRARDFNVTQMKVDNVVLLGSSRANPWEDMIQDRLNFRFGYDQKSKEAYFENRDPRLGESRFYRCNANFGYCQIAFIPNLADTGNLLAIAGTDIEGTAGCAEFVTSERSAAKVLALAGSGQGGRMPHFEALLKSTKMAGNSAALSIVAFRLVQPAGYGPPGPAAPPH